MTTRKTTACLALMAGLALAAGVRADEWDAGTDPDNSFSTDNHIFHGTEQDHDLGAQPGSGGSVPDEDWFVVPTHGFSSYQFVVDGMTGRLDLASQSVDRLLNHGVGVVQTALETDAGGALSLSWIAPSVGVTVPHFVRVRGASCGNTCNTLDGYRARFFETTYTIPRFNNTGSQSTILLVQNATDRSCIVTMLLIDADGAMINATTAGTIPPHRLTILNTASIAPNQSGTVRVVHTCGYGGLSGKAVSIEPATGFTFDTAMVPRPY